MEGVLHELRRTENKNVPAPFWKVHQEMWNQVKGYMLLNERNFNHHSFVVFCCYILVIAVGIHIDSKGIVAQFDQS